jgi:hypothetical protein
MALEYFKYNTGYTNTLVERSNTSFAPLVPPYKQIYIDYFIPEIQPLYLYKESAGNIVFNTQTTIDTYLKATTPAPTPNDYLMTGVFTGFTGTTLPLNYYNKTQINSYSGKTLTNINTRVYRSGDTMTGTLNTTANLTAVGMVSGSSVYGSVWIHSPIISGSSRVQAPITCGKTCVASPVLFGSTCSNSPLHCGACMLATSYICSPIITGSTKVSSPIVCATSCVNAPIVLGSNYICSPTITGSTKVCSPTIIGTTCLCSVGTTRLVGATTAASTLNVSGITKFQSDVCLLNPPTLTGSSSYTMFWNPNSKRIAVYKVSGGSTNYYYKECATICCTTSTTCIKYLGYTGTTMPAGGYQVDFTEQVGQSNSNATVYGAFKINNVLQGSDFLLKMNQAGFTFTNTLSRDITLPAGTNCFDMYYWAGGGTACATFASVRIRKI